MSKIWCRSHSETNATTTAPWSRSVSDRTDCYIEHLPAAIAIKVSRQKRGNVPWKRVLRKTLLLKIRHFRCRNINTAGDQFSQFRTGQLGIRTDPETRHSADTPSLSKMWKSGSRTFLESQMFPSPLTLEYTHLFQLINQAELETQRADQSLNMCALGRAEKCEHGYVTPVSFCLSAPRKSTLLQPFARPEQAHYGNVSMNLEHSRSLPINSLCMNRHTNRSLSVQLDSITRPSHTVTHTPCLCKHRAPHHCGITSIKDHISTWMQAS